LKTLAPAALVEFSSWFGGEGTLIDDQPRRRTKVEEQEGDHRVDVVRVGLFPTERVCEPVRSIDL
jgi:hypothetical protein